MNSRQRLRQAQDKRCSCSRPAQEGRWRFPLSLVARLEEFPRTSLENLGARQVVQYRGEILPLIDVSQELESTPARRHSFAADGDAQTNLPDTVPVVVYAEEISESA